jgi:hypothetical protein
LESVQSPEVEVASLEFVYVLTVTLSLVSTGRLSKAASAMFIVKAREARIGYQVRLLAGKEATRSLLTN